MQSTIAVYSKRKRLNRRARVLEKLKEKRVSSGRV